MTEARARSPCVGRRGRGGGPGCEIDVRTGWCFGCKRTLGEIAEWQEAGPQRRRAIMGELEERQRERNEF